ncbi:DciA family protein [Streptomyces smyrnaeus]|uniref:DciA family protein n=1 Tax=Streptomyces smyrnaeus TaxID=1387713 RepID=UPI0036A53897
MTPVVSIRDVLLTLERQLFGHVIASPAGRVRARWQQVVGPEIAIRVRVAGFDEQTSTLVVEGDSQAWVTQMRLLGPRLVQRLQEDGLPVSAVRVYRANSAPPPAGAEAAGEPATDTKGRRVQLDFRPAEPPLTTRLEAARQRQNAAMPKEHSAPHHRRPL